MSNAAEVHGALQEIHAKLDQVERAFANDDEVEADAARLSARKAIKTVRGKPALGDQRRLWLGTVYDALTFTNATAMSAARVRVLRRCFDAILTEPLPADLATGMRRDLDRAGFQLRPSSIDLR